jgi:hypothetical protein
MDTFRFALLAVGLCALSFIGISWGSKGFPVMATRIVDLKPDARIGTFQETVERGQREAWEASKTSQSDGNRERDKVRMELLQASTAYELSPCDATSKKDFVAALTNYVQAWHAMAECRPGVGGCPKSAGDRLDTAAEAFKTPLDIRVHQAARAAIEQGGISLDDFPRSLRNYVFLWTGPPPSEPAAACIAARQANRP